jgi:hypothetical protein
VLLKRDIRASMIFRCLPMTWCLARPSLVKDGHPSGPILSPCTSAADFRKVDPVMGGRYVPAVRAFFDGEYGINSARVSVPDGGERPWKESKRRV